MKRTKIAVISGVLMLVLCFLPAGRAAADAITAKPYIAFGADLNNSQKKKVMDLLAVTQEELADYETITVTNQDEHKYLDSYLDKSVIGTRALSSVKVEDSDESGVSVETFNINYCTKEMYTNALVTAGITDARVTVAAPFEISGTAALVGAMKAYAVMTGEDLDSENADAATNELVVTGELSDEVGKEKAAEIVALLKDKVVSGELSSEEEIQKALDEVTEEFDVNLSEQQKMKLTELMQKISKLDLDLETLQSQAEGIYEKLKDLDIDVDTAKGWLAKIIDFFAALFEKLVNFFKNMF